MTMAVSNATCPCGTAIVRDGVTVKSHWTGSICEDCEAMIFEKATAPHRYESGAEAGLHAFVPGAPHPADVRAMDLSAVQPLDRHWAPLILRAGDRVRQTLTGLGGKEIVTFEIDRALGTPGDSDVRAALYRAVDAALTTVTP